MFRQILQQVFVAAFLFHLSGCAHKTGLTELEVLSPNVLPGGWLQVKANDEIYRLARFAMRDVPNDSVVKVMSARAQPLVGTCYLLTFQMKSGKQWLAELYKDKKGSVILLEIQPLRNKDKKQGKKKDKRQTNKSKRSRL